MARLIPLRLQSSVTSTNHTRRDSTSSTSSSPSTPLTAQPLKSILRPRPGPVTELTIFPHNNAEWREVMEEVKVLYMKRQYKQCSARCIQIFESIKDPYRVHPLYQIYLSFFAASSLEETSRSLHLNSSKKLPLLQQSLTYYQSAESQMEYASFTTDPTIVQSVHRTRHNSSSSRSSSVRSSIDSVFSNTSVSSSTSSVPSPTSSVCSPTSTPTGDTTTHKRSLSAPPSNITTPAPLKPRKKVTFSVQLSPVMSDEDLAAADDSTILDYFPSPPTSATFASPPSPPPTPESSGGSIDDFLLSRALIRYRGHLSDLHNQLNYHIRSVERQIAELQKSRKAWRSNLPNIFTSFGQDLDDVKEEDRKGVELRARIERLKESGWKRERFDGTRYQNLCDKVMAEMT